MCCCSVLSCPSLRDNEAVRLMRSDLLSCKFRKGVRVWKVEVSYSLSHCLPVSLSLSLKVSLSPSLSLSLPLNLSLGEPPLYHLPDHFLQIVNLIIWLFSILSLIPFFLLLHRHFLTIFRIRCLPVLQDYRYKMVSPQVCFLRLKLYLYALTCIIVADLVVTYCLLFK